MFSFLSKDKLHYGNFEILFADIDGLFTWIVNKKVTAYIHEARRITEFRERFFFRETI